MTTFTRYNFMDLLKDHNYVPSMDENTYDIFQDVSNLFEKIKASLMVKSDDYNFMHLLKDNGYGFTPIHVPANDNVARLSNAA